MREIDPRDLSGGYADTVDAALRYARMSPVERAMSGADTRDLGAAPRGHRPGGDPVQQHSAGDLYPFVIAVHESPAYGRRYEVLGPKLGSGWWFTRNEDAEKCARGMKQGWERARRYRQQRTLGDYLANKYDLPYPDSDGGEA